jgi:hypothetical protein
MNPRSTCAISAACLILAAGPVQAFGIRVVNMTPEGRSAETNQDAEPTLTVDPRDTSRMAGSAFTYDNLTGSSMVTATAPIYVSIDRGKTWSLQFIVPSKIGSPFPTGDITLSFSSTVIGSPVDDTSALYAGTLSATTWPSIPVTVLRAPDPFSGTVMATLDTRDGNVDQPHTIAKTSPLGQDKLYVGFNNGWNCVISTGRTSTVDVSQDASVATPTFALDPIEFRNTSCQDGFAQVPAVHSDGTVYAAFIHDLTGSPRLVVVRDDSFATGTTPFTALTDPSDSVAGRFVTGTLTLPSGQMGQTRLGASNVSIAVDPRKSDRVYVAWGDSGGFDSEIIHVSRSVDRGKTWSTSDLLTVTNAMNPEIAINAQGTVGVLYQRVVSNRWEAHFVHTTDSDATAFDTPGAVLASTDATTPSSTFQPYIGDYSSLVSVGNDFFGMFSASNYPDKANFQLGITYARDVDWTAHKLYTDATHTVEVPPSIDPFFFEANYDPPLCVRIPMACVPVLFNPWWWLDCPACNFNVYLQLGPEVEEELVQLSLIDQHGRVVGQFQRVAPAIEIDGARYNYRAKLNAKKDHSYMLAARIGKGRKHLTNFAPKYVVKAVKGRSEHQ